MKKGDIVYHDKFGYGRIINSNSLTADVFFQARNTTKRIKIDYIRFIPKEEIDQKKQKHYLEEYKKRQHEVAERIAKSTEYISITKLKTLLKNKPNLVQNEDDENSLNYLINEHNLEYAKKEAKLYPGVFNIEGYELDDEQKLAVVSDEKSTLVVAGAGCGKTSMMIGKVAYLLKKGIHPSKILIISYTNKTVDDLNNRLKRFSVIPSTIHKLGKDIIGGRRPASDNFLRSIVNNLFGKDITETRGNKCCTDDLLSSIINKLKDNPIWIKLKRIIFEYIGLFFEENLNKEFESVGEKFTKKVSISTYENNKKVKTLSQIIKEFEAENKTLKCEKVKSLSEAQIANFLFLNGIDYEYEAEYPFQYCGKNIDKQKSYHPDFCITQGNQKIWIEHFGVTFDSNQKPHAHWCEEEDKYIEQMYEKIETHKKNHTVLVRTNESMRKNGELIEILENELHRLGVKFTPIPDEKIEKYVQKLKNWKRYEVFENFIQRYILLFKSQYKYDNLETVEQKLLSENPHNYKKIKSFFRILNEIYKIYQTALKDNKLIDFSDMIKEATRKLNNSPITHRYEYILVDEFQDVDAARCEFIKALQKNNDAKVFCVGDDWQSIYGFSGSDITIFNSFEKIFPDANDKLTLTNTHRNSQELLNITTKFIQENPHQRRKKLTSHKHTHTPITSVTYYKSKKDTFGIKGCCSREEAIQLIIDDLKLKNEKELVVLGRYSSKVDKFFSSDKFRIFENMEDFNIKYVNIHQAKGLEYRNVAVFLQEGNEILSFPSGFDDNYLIEPLLYNKNDLFPNAEERRLFYVALTRCKENCYVINSEENPSQFYEEIKSLTTPLNDNIEVYCSKTKERLCPNCQRGILQNRMRKDTGTTFLACDNNNCNLIISNEIKEKCPKCGGYLILKSENEYQKFYGCSNYRNKNCTFKKIVLKKTTISRYTKRF